MIEGVNVIKSVTLDLPKNTPMHDAGWGDVSFLAECSECGFVQRVKHECDSACENTHTIGYSPVVLPFHEFHP